MCSKFREGSITKLVGYTYPTLHKGKRWYVDFFAIDPANDCMKRKRYYISNDLKISDRKRRAAEVIAEGRVKLEGIFDRCYKIANILFQYLSF